MEQDGQVRSSCCALALGALLLAGCSSSPVVHPAATPFRGVLPAGCVVPHPPAGRQVGGPAGGAASNDRFTRAVEMDGGALQLSPPGANSRPAISARLAECNLRAGLTGGGFPIEETIPTSGLTFGLAIVTVHDSLLTGHSLTDGVTGPGMAQPPALQPYHQRLAWVAIVAPQLASSCPSGPATPPAVATPKAPVPRLPGYQALVIDAHTGADGFVYAAARNDNCVDRIDPPSLSPAVEQVSVPWTLVSRNADGYSANVDVALRSCDGTGYGDTALLISRDKPGLVTAEVRRPFNGCGPSTEKRYSLHAATVTSTLPGVLIHAPLGAIDTTP